MTLLLQGNAYEVMRILPSRSVNQIATSPPYWGQRNYGGGPREIGRERSVEGYLECLWEVFDEGLRVLADDGTCWVNLGDKYVKTCAQMIPERFAIGMVERGWILRGKVIWHKPSCKPESVKSRFTLDWEPIYFFAKSRSHFFSQQFEPYSESTFRRYEQFLNNGGAFDPTRHKQDEQAPTRAPALVLERIAKNLIVPGQTPNGMHVARAAGNGRDVYSKYGRNMRSVWSLSTAAFRGAHFAVWPRELVSRIIRAGCARNGTVLDPFVGTGTTLAQAEAEGCVGIGIDLRSEYLEIAQEQILTSRARRVKPRKSSDRLRFEQDGSPLEGGANEENEEALVKKHQLYRTPPHITQAIIRLERIQGSVLEPCVGKGDIVRALEGLPDVQLHWSDIHNWGFEGTRIRDFRTIEGDHYDVILTNPPHRRPAEFVRQGKKLADKVIVLLSLHVEHNVGWSDLRRDEGYPCKAVYAFTQSIRWVGWQGNMWGKLKYGWFVFEKGYKGPAIRKSITFGGDGKMNVE